MSWWRRPVAVAALALTGALLGPAAHADDRVPGHRLFSLAGEEIFESSGLVDRGRVVLTTNDSGDDAVLYTVDPSSGRTTGRTTYADGVQDVEALAPGSDRTVWVGDIGDNRERRDDVTVYRVTPGDDDPAPHVALTYPDGPHDAETLLAQPGSERLFVVSKSVFGGTVYAAPARVDQDSRNEMRPFAQVGGLVTDGAFFPDGRHVVLRTYTTASVYTFPAFDLVGTVRLPAQPQGEGISVSEDGRVLVSSEGVHADVLEVRLPTSLTAAVQAQAAPQGPPPATRAPSRVAHPDPPPRQAWDWAAIALVGAGLLGLGWLTVRASPPRGPRRR